MPASDQKTRFLKKRKQSGSLLALLFCFILALQLAQAQGGDPPPPTGLVPALRFAHLTADDGLAQNGVEAILQDKQGFIWIGTQDGLSRFDGYRFTTYKYDPTNPGSPSANYVRTIFEDREGKLWIATEGGGIDRFDPNTGAFTHYLHDPQNPNSLGGNVIFAIFQDSAGHFWFGGPIFSGLTKFNPATGVFTHYRPEPGNPKGFQGSGVWKIVEDDKGILWLAADNGLARLDPHTEEFTHYRASASEMRLAALLRDSAGNLWVGGSSGLYRFDPHTERLIPYPIGPVRVNTLYQDGDGLLWIGSHGEGLFRFDPQTGQIIQHYRHDPTDVHSLNGDQVTTLYQDRAGVLWIGTQTAGLNLLNLQQRRFVHYRHQPNQPDSLAVGAVQGISRDDEGIVWLGTGSTLNQVDLERGRVTQHTPEIAGGYSATIQVVYHDRAGYTWLGLSNRLLYRFDPATRQFSLYELPQVKAPAPPPGAPPGGAGPPKEIIGLYEDQEGALWIAVIRDGLYRLDPQRQHFQVFQQPPGGPRMVDDPRNIATNEISAMEGDQAGNIWLGYAFGMLSRLNPQTKAFEHYIVEPPLGWIEAIHVDQAGLVWAASRRGLIRFDPAGEALKRYTEQDGLPTAFVVGILEDPAGNLWLSTKKGLSKFDPHQETFRNYDALDGLQGNEFMPRSSWQAPDGQMFFGGANGLTTFYPEQISDNSYQSPVVLTEFRLFNEPILPGTETFLPQPIWDTDNLTLDYSQDIISFEFASLSYAAPYKNRYRYRLEGFEEDWNEVDSTRRSAAYTNLPAGNYLFRVQGTNNDGVWSNQEAALNLTILPPWWETTWFRAMGLLLIGGLVYSGYRGRVHAIEQRNRLLELQVAERTRDLREQEDQLRQAKEAAEAANQAKSTFLANMSHELRSPLNAILGFTQIIRRNQSLSQEMAENLGIIMRSGEHLLTLINQVLDLSKIEAGHIAFNDTDFDLYGLLDDLEDMFALKAEDKQLQLICDRPDDLPRYIRTDEVKLRQVLINLLNNALKFTQKGGVTLRVGVKGQGLGIRADEQALSPHPLTPLYFEIEDTGPGIAPHEMDRLFEAFAQTETGRQAQEGTGLGLPISRKFIQLMGGDITVKSQVGHGTIFSFNIQCEIVASIESQKAKAEKRIIALAPGQPRYRILVVDDKWTNRQLLIKLLNPLGFELREAQNGQEALTIWQEFEPHLIWMDMRMPVMDGFEATRRIKATTKGQATAIIALTASSFEEERAIVLSSGCDGFVRKPFREIEIFEMMSKHIGVQYIYEELNPEKEAHGIPLPTLPEALAEIDLLPPELLRQLTEGTELGDMELIDHAIIKIRHHQPVLAERLAQLARNFEYDKLLDLLQKVNV